MEELPHKMLFETFIFSDEERMNQAKQRSADGTFMWGGRKKARESERRQTDRASDAKGEDKSTPKAIWK